MLALSPLPLYNYRLPFYFGQQKRGADKLSAPLSLLSAGLDNRLVGLHFGRDRGGGLNHRHLNLLGTAGTDGETLLAKVPRAATNGIEGGLRIRGRILSGDNRRDDLGVALAHPLLHPQLVDPGNLGKLLGGNDRGGLGNRRFRRAGDDGRDFVDHLNFDRRDDFRSGFGNDGRFNHRDDFG